MAIATDARSVPVSVLRNMYAHRRRFAVSNGDTRLATFLSAADQVLQDVLATAGLDTDGVRAYLDRMYGHAGEVRDRIQPDGGLPDPPASRPKRTPLGVSSRIGDALALLDDVLDQASDLSPVVWQRVADVTGRPLFVGPYGVDDQPDVADDVDPASVAPDYVPSMVYVDPAPPADYVPTWDRSPGEPNAWTMDDHAHSDGSLAPRTSLPIHLATWREATDEQRLAKLPVWAQQLVRQLADGIRSLDASNRALAFQRSDADLADARLRVQPSGRRHREDLVLLSSGSVSFHPDGFHERDVRLDLELARDGSLLIRLHGTAASLAIAPVDGGAVAVFVRDRT